MSAVGFPDANYDKVSDGNSLFPITAEWGKKKDFFINTKERVIMYKNVNNILIETFLMEIRGSIQPWRVCCYFFTIAQKSSVCYLGL